MKQTTFGEKLAHWRAILGALLCTLLLPAPALAWNDSGHMQVALIAYQKLSPAQRQKAVELLREHPRFAQDFEARKPEQFSNPEQERQWIFAHAATWPDIAREQPTFDHATWHYINQPIYLSDEDRAAFAKKPFPNNISHRFSSSMDASEFNVVQALALVRQKLTANGVSKSERALYLSWLLHLVGDVHQPMHSVALYSSRRFPKGDKGGNDVLVNGNRNLHSTWDGFLGMSTQMSVLMRKTKELLKEPKIFAAAEAASSDLSVDSWVDESYELAENFAYDAMLIAVADQIESSGSNAKPKVFLPQSYFSEGRSKAEQRAAEAGFRLAALIQALKF